MSNTQPEDCRELAAQKYMIFVAIKTARTLERGRMTRSDYREMARELRQAAKCLEDAGNE